MPRPGEAATRKSPDLRPSRRPAGQQVCERASGWAQNRVLRSRRAQKRPSEDLRALSGRCHSVKGLIRSLEIFAHLHACARRSDFHAQNSVLRPSRTRTSNLWARGAMRWAGLPPFAQRARGRGHLCPRRSHACPRRRRWHARQGRARAPCRSTAAEFSRLRAKGALEVRPYGDFATSIASAGGAVTVWGLATSVSHAGSAAPAARIPRPPRACAPALPPAKKERPPNRGSLFRVCLPPGPARWARGRGLLPDARALRDDAGPAHQRARAWRGAALARRRPPARPAGDQS